MESTTDLLRGELERLFELDELIDLSTRALGVTPEELGGQEHKGSFARSLVSRCERDDALQALADAVVLSAPDADHRLKDLSRSANGELTPGTEIGDLKVVRKLGEGGLGVVYLCERVQAHGGGERVALKVIRPEYAHDRSAVHRYKTLSRLMQAMQLEGFAPVLGVGQLADARPWVAFQFVDGQSLAERVKATRGLDFSAALPLLRDVLTSLGQLHHRGVAHGDLKTDNVLLVDGERTEAVLVDCGTDRLLSPITLHGERTGSLALLGTPKALAPELVSGAAPSPASDVYAAGVLIYEVLTGRPPFVGEHPISVIGQHLSASPEPPSAVARKGRVPKIVDTAVLKALAKNPRQRPRSASELLQALESAARRSVPPPRPAVQNRAQFERALAKLRANPTDDELVLELEQLAAESGMWEEAASGYSEVVQHLRDPVGQLGMLLRIARIHDNELDDPEAAEAAYTRVLELDAENPVALAGLETIKRAQGDAGALAELLLTKIEKEQDVTRRARMLAELAALYHDKLADSEAAFAAWVQALADAPRETRPLREVERLATTPERWQHAIDSVTQAAEQLAASFQQEQAESEIAPDESTHLIGSQQDVEEAGGVLAQAEAQVKQLEQQLKQVTQKATVAASAREEAEAVEQDAHQAAEGAVQAYEAHQAAADAVGATAEAHQAAAQAAALAQKRVERADVASTALEAAAKRAEAAEKAALSLQPQVAAARQRREAARAHYQQLREAPDTVPPVLASGATEHKQGIADLVRLHLVLGRWYSERLNRPDLALPAFSQALTIDPANERAYEGMSSVYRTAQSWPELVGVLSQRAESTANPVKARDLRTEAAVITYENLDDPAEAERQLRWVLEQDPAHPAATQALAELLVQRGDAGGLARQLAQQAGVLHGKARAEVLNQLGQIQEEQMQNPQEASVHYAAAFESDRKNLTALRGLERCYASLGSTEPLLEVLRTQLELTATNKQRVQLLERIGEIEETQAQDAAAAASSFERALRLEPQSEAAVRGLVRVYRQLGRLDDVVATLERHAKQTSDAETRIGLLLELGDVLLRGLGAPESALRAFEQVLRLNPEHPQALELVARVKVQTGDADAAIQAIERLAESEQDPSRRAEANLRAARLLTERGDKERAALRYRTVLQADPNSLEALQALRDLAQERGDAKGAIEFLERELQLIEDPSQRASRFAELGRLYRSQLQDPHRAQEAFSLALELDASCVMASLGLGELAHQDGDYALAAQYLQPLLETTDLPADEARDLYLSAADAFRGIGDAQRARRAAKLAAEVAPDDVAVHERLAQTLLETGDTHGAEKAYRHIVRHFERRLDVAQRLRLLLAAGDAALKDNNTRKAIDWFRKAAEIRPDDPDVLGALARGYREAKQWNELIDTLQLRARLADPEQRFDYLVEIGDVLSEQLDDRDAAATTYVAALELRSDDRNLLTKLMAMYSETQDWTRLIEVILRIAAMVDDSAQLAKYYNTAATIAHTELGRFGEAANYYEGALAADPNLSQAFSGLVDCLTRNQDWERLEQIYSDRIESVRESAEPTELAKLLDARADVLEHRLGRLEEAVAAYEEAAQLDPGSRGRNEHLTAIYTADPDRFFDRAVAAHHQMLETNAYKVESYQALRRIYTSMKMADASWCLCQALRTLSMADIGEEKFFKKYRSTQLPRLTQVISEDMWQNLLCHPQQDPLLTRIFGVVTPVALASLAQPLETLGVTAECLADPQQDPTAMTRMLAYVAGTLQVPAPMIYHRPNDGGGLSFLFTTPPSLGMGEAARAGGPEQALAFVAGRQLSFFRDGHLLRQLVPTGTGLRAWLIAAIKVHTPQFPVPTNLAPQVNQHLQALNQHVVGPQRELLRNLTQRLLQEQPELDLRRWIAGVDLTADRVGFVLANDLKVSKAVMDASPQDASAIARKERVRQLLLYSVAQPYLQLRQEVGISLG